MKNKALLVVPLIIFTCGVQPVCASENDNITINFVTEEKLEENFRTSLSQNSSTNEIHAYEIDNEGNSKEVNPISNSFRMRKPPVDGFKYSPNSYQHSSGTLNNYFSHVGSFTIKNSGTTSITGKYVQEQSVTTNWSVGGAISAESTFKVAFISQVKAKVAASADYSKTTKAGTTYSVQSTVPPKKTMNVNAYRKGAKSTGKLVWNKYSPSGSLMGIYTETNHSGTAPFNGMTFDVSVK